VFRLVVLHVPYCLPFEIYSLCSGWCGEVRDVIYTDSGKVTVIYRVTVRGTDGEVPHQHLHLLQFFAICTTSVYGCSNYLALTG
jgi:hypothetical protein